ncbi:MAG: Asp-tRNA(Asn)/Glu-tRNA(Gln) amidotransferase subunit GatB [Candidatus Zambryskibacteria bacterium]|nr:Asp-tRNA(Asn)/Glu-tRNA(Gln) amidotransferase subunit GatB [Candidatus Zambryskibacteria bacterium]
MKNVKYKPTIGLEIHAELRTKTKMFCACKNDPDEKRPNINICPICMGHPGTLPVINKEAVKQVLRVGLAVNGQLADFTEFDRKNYFYPDIPKGYQISQYKHPLVSGGELLGVKLTRIHLEEDTAKSSHEARSTSDEEKDRGSNLMTRDSSFVDFNRAGVPLMELVTEPVINSSEQVLKFGQELQLLLQYLGVSKANMEKGEMRLEANISVSKDDNLGTKVEIKNLNSFKAAEKAIEYEIKRQIDLLENGGKVEQETRGWDENKQSTFSQRSKEDSHDYRYFPEPDLPKLKLSELSEFSKEILSNSLKETPAEKRERFKKYYAIKTSDIDFYVSNILLGNLFEKTVKNLEDKNSFQLLSNYIVSDIASLGEKGLEIDDKKLAFLIRMAASGEISSRGAKDILIKMIESDEDPKIIAQKTGLFQKSDKTELEKIAKQVISENESVVSEYKKGKTSSLQFLVGQGMKASKGAANPQVLKDILEKLLN